MDKIEPVIAELEEQIVPIKFQPMGRYYVLTQVIVTNPTHKIIIMEGQAVGDNFPWWKVLARGPDCEQAIFVGDMVILPNQTTGRNVAITGTPYKVVTEVEILGLVDQAEAIEWGTTIADNVASVIAADIAAAKKATAKPSIIKVPPHGNA